VLLLALLAVAPSDVLLIDGVPITLARAPVLVADISLEDPDTGEEFTLDGVLGMNYLSSQLRYRQPRGGRRGVRFPQLRPPVGRVFADVQHRGDPRACRGAVVRGRDGRLVGPPPAA